MKQTSKEERAAIVAEWKGSGQTGVTVSLELQSGLRLTVAVE